MNKDYLKFLEWLCSKAKGFTLSYDPNEVLNVPVIYIEMNGFTKRYIVREKTFCCILYPLLISDAIDGVNREQGKWRIIQTDTAIRLYDSESDFTIPENIFKFSDMVEVIAKESVLKYLNEQEKSNGS